MGKLNIDFNTDYYYGEETELRTTTEQSANYDNRTVTSAGTHATSFCNQLVLSHPLFGGNLSVGNENTFTNHEQSYTNQEGIVANAASAIKERNNAFFFRV